jgi:hypothetical protein
VGRGEEEVLHRWIRADEGNALRLTGEKVCAEGGNAVSGCGVEDPRLARRLPVGAVALLGSVLRRPEGPNQQPPIR